MSGASSTQLYSTLGPPKRTSEARYTSGKPAFFDAPRGPSYSRQVTTRARSESQSETTLARRGFVWITGAKLWFLLAGTGLNIGLPRLLGDPARYGDFGVVNTFISIVNMVMITGALQVVSKRVSERPHQATALRRRALTLQLGVGVAVLVLLLASADLIARWIFRDASLAGLIRIASLVTFAYCFYAVLIGVLNGLKRFGLQAAFDVGFATLKLLLIVGLVAFGFGVEGAFAGFAVAAFVITIVALYLVRRVPAPPAPASAGLQGAEPPRFLGFMVQVMAYTFVLNALLQGDVIVLKGAAYGPVSDALGDPEGRSQLALLLGQGQGAAAATESTAALSGLYRATKNIALVPYQAVVAITFVVFPLISRATFVADRRATERYIAGTLRAALLLVALVGALIAAGGEPLLVLLFGEGYALAASSLLPLVGAMCLFALFYVIATILIAGGRPGDALVVTLVAAVVQLGGVYFAVASTPAGAGTLQAGALVTLVAVAMAVTVAAWIVTRRFDVRLPILTALRVTAAASAGVAAAAFVDLSGLGGLVIRVGLAGCVYFAVLFIGGELGRSDLRQLRGLVRRSRPESL